MFNKKMNKKGYLRMIEAVIAIVIIFGFILTVLPKKAQDTGAIPPELDSTLRAILEEAQNNEEFRSCLLLNNDINLVTATNPLQVTKKNLNCLGEQISSSLSSLSPWDYAFAICPTNNLNDCALFTKLASYTGGGNSGSILSLSDNKGLPTDRNVYTKSTVISKPDVIAKPYSVKGGDCCGTLPLGTTSCELNVQIKDTSTPDGKEKAANCISLTGKTIILYLWAKN